MVTSVSYIEMALDQSLGPFVGSSVTSIFVRYFKPMTSPFLSHNLMLQCQVFKT